MIHLGEAAVPWTLRGSLMTHESMPAYLLQMTPIGKITGMALPDRDDSDRFLDRIPDAVTILDDNGAIKKANSAFADLVEVGSPDSVVDKSLGRWLLRPGADVGVNEQLDAAALGPEQ